MTAQLVRTAFHEAGHALLAYRVGDDIQRVTIRRKGNVLGSLFHNRRTLGSVLLTRPGLLSAALHAAVMVMVAGPLAEVVLGRRPAETACLTADYDKAKQLAAAWSSMPETVIATAEVMAWQVLRQSWAQVAALAETLLIDRTIEGSRAVEIMRTAQPMPRLHPRRRTRGNCRCRSLEAEP